jgi:hypothetical protein
MQPKIIRLKDATTYSGMDINKFNKDVRPHVREFSIGTQGIGFDRLELDTALEEYMRRNERPKENKKLWVAKERQDSTYVRAPGKSTKLSKESAFAKALEQVTSKKRRDI